MTKPYTEDGINYTLHGCVIRILTVDDVIEEGDFIRPLYESPMYSESGGWDTTYKNDKWRGPKWHRVEDDLSGWVGHSYRDYLNFCNEDEEDWVEKVDFMMDEIVRIVEA